MATYKSKWAASVVGFGLGTLALVGCSDATEAIDSANSALESAQAAAESAKDSLSGLSGNALLEALRESDLVRNSESYVAEQLDAGVSKADLKELIEVGRATGNISNAAACVQTEIVDGGLDLSAIGACKRELLVEVGSSIG